MTIKIVNFETLSKHYQKYQEGINKIGDAKKEFVERLKPFREELESIIEKMNSGEQQNLQTESRFQELQAHAMEIDDEYKAAMRNMNDELSKEIYDDLSDFIKNWSSDKDIDMVMSSTEVVFVKPESDITNDILELLKEKQVYI